MGQLGLVGALRGKVKRTTIPGPAADRPGDLVRRRFDPAAPNRLWVADFTYVSTWSGWVYVAFVIDAYSRRILGWRCSTAMTTPLVLDAVEQAIWTRAQAGVSDLAGLVHHSDRGSQYGALAMTDRLLSAGIDPSVGATGSSYDNALAETINGLYKTELIKRRRPWKTLEQVEIATWSGSTGSTTAGSTATATTCPPPSSRPPTTVTTRPGHRPRSQPCESPDTPGRFT